MAGSLTKLQFRVMEVQQNLKTQGEQSIATFLFF